MEQEESDVMRRYETEFKTRTKVETDWQGRERVYHIAEFYVNGDLLVYGDNGDFSKERAIEKLKKTKTVSLILELIEKAHGVPT